MQSIDIINYWYSDRLKKHWFASTPELDAEILKDYKAIWERALIGELDDWQESPEGCLALVIILDQFPLNMYRGQAKSFQSEAKAIEITQKAINNHYLEQLDKEYLSFLLMPLMHSEQLSDQDLSVTLFKQYDLQQSIRFAEHHRGLIQEFGRFPHRNIILARANTPDEQAYLESDRAFTG